jgi:TnpA family transposase
MDTLHISHVLEPISALEKIHQTIKVLKSLDSVDFRRKIT